MASEFSLAIVSPDREVLDRMTTHVMLPGASGYFGVFGGHEPILFALKAGEIEYMDGPLRKSLMISGGFAEVTPTRVTVLADSITG